MTLNKWVKIYGTVFIILTVGFVSFLGGMEAGKRQPLTDDVGNVINQGLTPEYLRKTVDFNQFWRLWDLVKTKHYKQPVNEVKFLYGAEAGLVASLDDPYSVFFEPKVATEFSRELSGSIYGIGAAVSIKKDVLTVVAPLSETPADRAGLKPGDKILAIDGLDTRGMALDLAVSKIRGDKGTTVKLLIMRDGFSKAKEFAIVRDNIQVKSVRYELKNNISYIKVTHFNEDTGADFSKTVEKVLNDNPRGVIIDLRNNPGGYLNIAVDMIGEWMAEDIAVIERFTNNVEKEYKTDGRARLNNYPTVILINKGSASASEILAGALQDYGRAKVVGEQSFGKGTVQSYEEFADGSALKLTVAEWLTPKKRAIDKNGITPDVVIELTEENVENMEDPQLDKALELLK